MGYQRMPVGSSDFADSYYSLDDTAGDLAVGHLNLTRDNGKLIPFIKAAMEIHPEMRLWGSPWPAPTWMKDSAPQMLHNEGCGSLSPDPRLREARALCTWRGPPPPTARQGFRFEYAAIQNEPNQGATWDGHSCSSSYPKMHWTGEQLHTHTFVRDHLGPSFERQGPKAGREGGVGIILGTFSVDDFDGMVKPPLADPKRSGTWRGIRLQTRGWG